MTLDWLRNLDNEHFIPIKEMPVADRTPVDFLPEPVFSNGGTFTQCKAAKSSPKQSTPSLHSFETFEKPAFWLVFCSVVSHTVMLLGGYIRNLLRNLGLCSDPCPLDLPKHQVCSFYYHSKVETKFFLEQNENEWPFPHLKGYTVTELVHSYFC